MDIVLFHFFPYCVFVDVHHQENVIMTHYLSRLKET